MAAELGAMNASSAKSILTFYEHSFVGLLVLPVNFINWNDGKCSLLHMAYIMHPNWIKRSIC